MWLVLLIFIVIVGLVIINMITENNARKKFEIPSSGKKIKYFQGYNKPLKKEIYYWRDSRSLHFCNSRSKSEPLRIVIPKDNIIGFAMIGDLITSTSIKGGGTSLGGAAVGGLLLGPVGAIIGSRKKVKSKTKTDDTRQVVLNFKEDNTEKAILLDHLIYNDLCVFCASKRLA